MRTEKKNIKEIYCLCTENIDCDRMVMYPSVDMTANCLRLPANWGFHITHTNEYHFVSPVPTNNIHTDTQQPYGPRGSLAFNKVI